MFLAATSLDNNMGKTFFLLPFAQEMRARCEDRTPIAAMTPQFEDAPTFPSGAHPL